MNDNPEEAAKYAAQGSLDALHRLFLKARDNTEEASGRQIAAGRLLSAGGNIALALGYLATRNEDARPKPSDVVPVRKAMADYLDAMLYLQSDFIEDGCAVSPSRRLANEQVAYVQDLVKDQKRGEE